MPRAAGNHGVYARPSATHGHAQATRCGGGPGTAVHLRRPRHRDVLLLGGRRRPRAGVPRHRADRPGAHLESALVDGRRRAVLTLTSRSSLYQYVYQNRSLRDDPSLSFDLPLRARPLLGETPNEQQYYTGNRRQQKLNQN